MLGHGTCDNWGDHERSHVDDPVEGVPFATVVEEENIGDNSWLNGFGRTSANAVDTIGY